LKYLINSLKSHVLIRKVEKKMLQMCPAAITHVETCHPVAALTFDDGPHPIFTPRVLSILEKHRVKATFFMLGMAANRYPEIVKMVSRAGHVIGNHSWDHPSLTNIRSRFLRFRQMWACERATAPYCKRYLRPPFGAHDSQIRFDALLLRYKVILWSESAQDWISQESEEIANKIKDRIAPGTIFLLHDAVHDSQEPGIFWDRGPMIDGLEMALSALKNQIQFVTIPKLLRSGHPVSNWPREVVQSNK
jgi:peptidoglycan/xylan/chitin deacetylase (PgdA/CDA1 family)